MQIARIVLATLVIFSAAAARADVVTAKGKASMQYQASPATCAVKKKVFVDCAASPDIKAAVVQAAQMKAIEFYFADAGDSEVENLDTIRGIIRNNPDRFILDTTILDELDDPASLTYSVTVRVSLNGSALRLALKSAVGPGTVTQGSQMAFVFLSRQVDTQTTFDARVTKRAVVDVHGNAAVAAQRSTNEGETVRKTEVSTNESVQSAASIDANVQATVERGGASMARSDATTWKIIPSQGISGVVTQIFKAAGYRVADAQFIEPLSGGKLKVVDIQKDYESGDDLQTATLMNVVEGLRTAEVRYIALATLDVGMVGDDPATGLKRMVVTVNGKVLDVSQRIPESVAIAGPAQYAGVGPTAEEATTNALKLAAQSAARDLTSQLANAGLH
ncbi:MAG: hypothetical protein FWD64_03495 [Acidobacteriaceae bacterium]|nr:hypothetical protein [Acidobacteriaceae bacterium]